MDSRAYRFGGVIHVMKAVKRRQQRDGEDGDKEERRQCVYLKRQGESIQISEGSGIDLRVEQLKDRIDQPQQASKANAQGTGRFHEDKLTPKKKRHKASVKYQRQRKEKVIHNAPFGSNNTTTRPQENAGIRILASGKIRS